MRVSTCADRVDRMATRRSNGAQSGVLQLPQSASLLLVLVNPLPLRVQAPAFP